MRAAYDEVADSYADHFRCTEPEQDVELAVVAHFASLLPGRREVLDAGCGAGRMMPLLAGLGCAVSGLDLSPGMVRRARTDHPGFSSVVGSLTHLPYADGSFDGLFSWYSTIHSSDVDLALVAGEAHRVVRPGGLVLVAFQAGHGTRDVSEAYRRHGQHVVLERHNRTADVMADVLAGAGLAEVARLVRGPVGGERDGQAVVVARRPSA